MPARQRGVDGTSAIQAAAASIAASPKAANARRRRAAIMASANAAPNTTRAAAPGVATRKSEARMPPNSRTLPVIPWRSNEASHAGSHANTMDA